MIDAILILMYVVVAGAIGIVAWAAIRRWQLHDRTADTSNGIPSRKIVVGVVGGMVLCLLLTFLMASSAPMLINGKRFDSVFWLKTGDMLINTSLILLVVAVIVVVCSNVRNARSRR
ncbi:MAG: hypothetical protein J6I61_05965 [Prevotella sp.]|nr:hypothetical protein [Prevotella sp.]